MSETGTKILGDIVGLLTGAGALAQSARSELEQKLAARLDALLADKTVSREEFEMVREMASLARQENIALKKELAALKRKPSKKAAPKKAAPKKSSPKKAPAKKPSRTKK